MFKAYCYNLGLNPRLDELSSSQDVNSLILVKRFQVGSSVRPNDFHARGPLKLAGGFEPPQPPCIWAGEGRLQPCQTYSLTCSVTSSTSLTRASLRSAQRSAITGWSLHSFRLLRYRWRLQLAVNPQWPTRGLLGQSAGLWHW